MSSNAGMKGRLTTSCWRGLGLGVFGVRVGAPVVGSVRWVPSHVSSASLSYVIPATYRKNKIYHMCVHT